MANKLDSEQKERERERERERKRERELFIYMPHMDSSDGSAIFQVAPHILGDS